MALIKCNECGHMISSNAHACPKCGCPVEHEVKRWETCEKTLNSSKTIAKTKGSKTIDPDIKWLIIIPILILIIIIVGSIILPSNPSTSPDSYTTETTTETYGPGTYEFVDEAKQKWQLIIELETEGSEADYSLVEHKNCKLKNKSNGKEYKGFWYDDLALYHKKGEHIPHQHECFRIFFQFGSKTNYRCPFIFQKNAEFNDWFYLEDGYIYINSDQKEDTNGKGFGFEEAFINRDPRIRLPIKRIK